MDEENFIMDEETIYPILIIPKNCILLETNTQDNIFLDLNITSPDNNGNETTIYSGTCNIRLVENYVVEAQQMNNTGVNPDEMPIIIADSTQALPSYNQSEVWIDPSRSPYVYNHYDTSESQESYSSCNQTSNNLITLEQYNTYITESVNSNESVHHSPHEEFDRKKSNKYLETQASSYEENKFLSQLPEETINEKEIKAKEEKNYIGLQSEDGVLKQLMSSDIQLASKQQKTVLYLGPDSNCGETVKQIAITDPMMRPRPEVACELIHEDYDRTPKQKKYQCAKCQQIFHQRSEYRDHMINHRGKHSKLGADSRANSKAKYVCFQCGKNLKTKKMFELHSLSHGNPELECNECHKVFATKFTLSTHRKIHTRKYACVRCANTYSKVEYLREHAARAHFVFMCKYCDFVGKKFSDLTAHETIHDYFARDSRDFGEESFLDKMSESGMITPSPEGCWQQERGHDQYGTRVKQESQENGPFPSNYEEIKKADSVLAKVISSKFFLAKNTKRNRTDDKDCEICYKKFDRISDLKRHLLEHVVRSTLAKTPVSKNGTLNIQCEVCHARTFNKIDHYKAHLREHVKLKLYQCNFCNKSFSDSSNYCKHKKIHGGTYFQCDLCQRKFNSKKMVTQHMLYHENNTPVACRYCDKVFHFESTLKKHIKAAHTRELSSRYRCQFCHGYFNTLRDKWDHEWSVHNARKMIVDCLICGCKFRKYAELKRHCSDDHNMDIPLAKKLFKKKSETRAGSSSY